MKKLFMSLFVLQLLSLVFFLISPITVLAQTCPPGATCIDNPLKLIGVSGPGDLVSRAFTGFAVMVGAIAIAFTVLSGFKLIIATSEESIKSARESLQWSVGGFVVALLAFTIIAGTAEFLGYQAIDIKETAVIQNPLKESTFLGVMNAVMLNFLGIIGFVSTLMIIYYGYRYMASAGNEEAMEKAKTGLKWAVVGLAITFLAYAIIAGVRVILLSNAPTN